MKLIQKIKQWRDRRFQKRVLNALGATIAEDGAIVFNKTIRSRGDIQCCDPRFLQSDGGTMQGRLVADAPTIETDEIHNVDSGVPV